MRDTYLHIRHQPVENFIYGIQFLHLVVKEEYLASPVQLVIYYALYLLFVEKDYFGLCGYPVGRRGVNYRKVPGAEKGELKGPWYRGGGQSEGIHRRFQLTEFLLCRHSELLFLIYDQKPKVLELKTFPQHLVGTYHYVEIAGLQPGLYVVYLFRGPEPADIIDGTGKILKPGGKSCEMLEGKDGCRNQDYHLFPVSHGLESRPDGYFCFAETNVAADKPIHRALILHILLDRLGSRFLVGSILIHKGRFELFLKIRIGRKSETS